jgi:uncharacterized protein (DUF433 family)
MSYSDIITIEPGKRGGKPCIRRMRITVYDVLGWLAAGMSTPEIIEDFPELMETDIRACLEFAADREHRLVASVRAGIDCQSHAPRGFWAHVRPTSLRIYHQLRMPPMNCDITPDSGLR